jgi:hypothetical protein
VYKSNEVFISDEEPDYEDCRGSALFPRLTFGNTINHFIPNEKK